MQVAHLSNIFLTPISALKKFRCTILLAGSGSTVREKNPLFLFTFTPKFCFSVFRHRLNKVYHIYNHNGF